MTRRHPASPLPRSTSTVDKTKIENNSFAGGFSLGPIYQKDRAAWGTTIASNALSNGTIIQGTYSNTRGPFTVKSAVGKPDWLVPGLKAFGVGAPSGATVASVTSNSFTLSTPISGSISTGDFFTFFDPRNGSQVGLVHFGTPAGDNTKGTGNRSLITDSAALSSAHYEDIEFDPGGGTINFTIPNDASFGAQGHGGEYLLIQSGAGAVNIVAGAGITVRGQTSVGGQNKVAHLRYAAPNAWLVY
jgi:hypothetical protein